MTPEEHNHMMYCLHNAKPEQLSQAQLLWRINDWKVFLAYEMLIEDDASDSMLHAIRRIIAADEKYYADHYQT